MKHKIPISRPKISEKMKLFFAMQQGFQKIRTAWKIVLIYLPCDMWSADKIILFYQLMLDKTLSYLGKTTVKLGKKTKQR